MKQVNLVNLSMRDLSMIIVSQMHAGKSRDDMVQYLHQRGWPENNARRFVANATAGIPGQPASRTKAWPHGLPLRPMLWLAALAFLGFIASVLLAR